MRITYLHQYFVTPRMSGGSRSYEMARRLVAAGHEVHVVTSDQRPRTGGPWWQETNESGIHVHWTPVPYDNTMRYGDRFRAFLSFASRSAWKAASLRSELIFATSTPLTIALPAVYAARVTGRPMVFEVRDLWPAVPIAIGALRNPLLQAAARWMERFAYRNAAHVVALAPGMRDEIAATGYPADRITVIPNGCDLDVFGDQAVTPVDVRSAHPWLGDRPMLLFSGTFGLVNGMEYLVRLATDLASVDSEIRVVAVGDGREFESTRVLAARAGVLDRTLFLLGRLPKLEAATWTRAADMTLALFTGPEIVWRDAVQNKFFDSLAAGKPVANNFPGWQARIAAEAGAGLILSATDSGSAARAIAGALRDAEWLARAGDAARRLARERFDRDLLGAQLARLLEGVQAGHQ